MFDTFPVVVPTLGRRLPGVLRPVECARAGVLLLEGTGAQAALVPRIFAELELYFQAANFATVRLSVPPDAKVSTRVSGVLGGVSLLRSMGASRVLVITSAVAPLASWEQARAGTLAEFIEMPDQGQPLPDIIRIVRDLTTTIREVADSTIGVATLVTPAQSPRGAERQKHEKCTTRRSFASTHDTGTTRSSPQALLLTVPSPEDPAATRRAVAFLLARLYSWSLALTQDPRESTMMRVTTVAESAIDTANQKANGMLQMARLSGDLTEMWMSNRVMWPARLRWADEQWDDLLRRFSERAPDQASSVHAAVGPLRDQTRGSSLRAARIAWPLLDVQARYAWLHICSALFTSVPLRSWI